MEILLAGDRDEGRGAPRSLTRIPGIMEHNLIITRVLRTFNSSRFAIPEDPEIDFAAK
jgi:hypothetical protein